MLKVARNTARFTGDGYSFCVVKGVIYHCDENGYYDSECPRLTVNQAVEHLKVIPKCIAAKKLLDDAIRDRDKFDQETSAMGNQLEELKMKISGRDAKRQALVSKIGDLNNNLHSIRILRNKNGNSLITVHRDCKSVSVGCNTVPISLARKLAVRLLKLGKK